MDAARFYDEQADYLTDADAYPRAYHQMRLDAADALVSDLSGTIYEFGCGLGILLKRLERFRPARGCDISPKTVELAKQQTGLDIRVGGIDDFEQLTERFTVVASLNVLPYLTEAEEDRFYAKARTIADYVLVSHTNRLFDLVTFNRYTVEFFAEHCAATLGVDAREAAAALRDLLTHPDRPSHGGSERDLLTKRRVDPFTYAPDGFDIIGSRYINQHPLPPMLLDKHPRWKMASLTANMDPTLARIFCSQFQLLLKPKPC